MGAFRQWSSIAGVWACCAVLPASASAHKHAQPETRDSWAAALAAREIFEAEPGGTHTKLEYVRVMEGFRAIYHGNPRDAHAARAAEQVAELLAEQGREFHDRKSLHDAAGQYVFVARSYPGGTRAADALAHAADLLGPAGADDRAEAKAVREELAGNYPQDVYPGNAGRAAGSNAAQTGPAQTTTAQTSTPAAKRVSGAAPQAEIRAEGESSLPSGQPGAVPTPVPVSAIRLASAEPVRTPAAPAGEEVTAQVSGARAQVTGIRHWSTSSYTRVAIDLGGEVQYQAARVENPDRIFFDLHHTHLASQLAGKSFAVTDDGFLTRIRAAQFTDDVTRVVLDVHEVTEYSAFLLPNPYRLIIDIHGKQETASGKQEVANGEGAGNRGQGTPAPLAAQPPGIAQSGGVVPSPGRRGEAATSGLPPMPVTDGGAGFGLPAKSAISASVAEPRVVIPSKSTLSRPVPNSVPVKSDATGTEVAAVSRQPGKVEATSHPTSAPIVARSRGVEGAPSEAAAKAGAPNGLSSGKGGENEIAEIARGDHYRKPSHRSGNAAGAVTRTMAAPAEAAPPTADGETSLMRALGLKIGRIVIDAGHGGHDSGTIGVDGIEEKDVVLDVALRLGKLLHDRLGSEIVYTRADDTFIPLETRTAIANKAQADLFISVHANSSPDPGARGVEVYYLNFTSDPDAMRVAGRENAVSTQSVHELSDLVKQIALKDKIEESRELAADVDQSLYAGLAKVNDGLKDRGVKKAPFVVLIGANMPSILAEISFVTNATDAEKLRKPEYRERVAESIYGGVARYAGAINGRPKRTEQRAQR